MTQAPDGVVVVERRLDMEHCRVMTTYIPAGLQAPDIQPERKFHNYLSLIRMLRRINERSSYFE